MSLSRFASRSIRPAGDSMIVKSNRELRALYNELGGGDIFIGHLSQKFLKESMLIDLLERGVYCLPSALSQVLNSSKVTQALVLKDWMLPQTLAITRRTDLIDAINQYNKHGIGAVVTKQDGMHCGHGIRRWETIETLYSFMAFSDSSFPFVLQPFHADFKDVRVIIVGDYIEAYTRKNPYNFRVNIGLGGTASAFRLDSKMEQLCRAAMARGKFPFGHIDLMLTDTGECYLSEIALNGGIKGARISREELDQKKQVVLDRLAKRDHHENTNVLKHEIQI
jgi:glutathione synthase/RimK-type ligase-like ATP-grasp enzyme